MNWKIWLIIAPAALIVLWIIWRAYFCTHAKRRAQTKGNAQNQGNAQKSLHDTEARLAINRPSIAQARAAVLILLEKQRADVNSFNIRTDLQITKLETVRAELALSNESYQSLTATLPKVLDREAEMVQGNAFAKVKEKEWQLQSTSTMVNSFHQSLVFFRQKWQAQLERLMEDYPLTQLFPDECGLGELQRLPDDILTAEAKLRVALKLDLPITEESSL